MVDGPPRVVVFAIDPQNHLVQMPCVTWPWTAATGLIRILLPKLLALWTDRFIIDDGSTTEEEFINVVTTETATMADALRWEAAVLLTVR